MLKKEKAAISPTSLDERMFGLFCFGQCLPFVCAQSWLQSGLILFQSIPGHKVVLSDVFFFCQTICGQLDNTKPSCEGQTSSRQQQDLLDSIRLPGLLFPFSKIYSFRKTWRHRMHWEENEKLPGSFFLPEWEYQREGETKKASHHVRAGSAVEFSSWQRWVPTARKYEKINSELPSKANSALVGKRIGTRLHSEVGVHVC